MNPYCKNIDKIEFAVTYACTGKCKHCFEGDHKCDGERIDPKISAEAVRAICEKYDVKTVMVFGGEPLLYLDSVYEIISTATKLGVPKRQVITNGYFSNDESVISKAAEMLLRSGVNDLLLSIDAFHQETIPLKPVREFALALKKFGVPVRLHPAWLVSREDENPYNALTKEILKGFLDMDIPIADGNIVYPEGNAIKYLSEYFSDNPPENPYVEDPCNVKCISVEPNGDVLDSNLYREGIIEIIDKYAPVSNNAKD